MFTVLDLADALTARRGAQIISLLVRTKPALTSGKKCPLAGRMVERIGKVGGVVNWSYRRAVNRQRTREAHSSRPFPCIFEPLHRAWGRRVEGTPFVVHTSREGEKRVYLELKLQHRGQARYFVDGIAVEPAIVEPHLRDRDEGTRQEVEEEVILRDYRLSSIISISFAGQTRLLFFSPAHEAELHGQLASAFSANDGHTAAYQGPAHMTTGP